MKGIVLIGFILAMIKGNAVAGVIEFESYRCKNSIATRGDTKQDVQQKCEQPYRIQCVNNDCREMWQYNFGPNEFMQGICFGNTGRVKKLLSHGIIH